MYVHICLASWHIGHPILSEAAIVSLHPIRMHMAIPMNIGSVGKSGKEITITLICVYMYMYSPQN
jgi:hypothetical protein